MNNRFLISCLLGVGALHGQAQTAAPAVPVKLDNFVVSASPWARAQDELAQPTSVLAGARLVQQRQPSLGETLANEPGISSTYFGPGASRPVIRGLGGDRIRVLSGGVGTLDASTISPDHAVSLDPLLIDRIEIVRGPATLLYGGSAVGGVVNVVDARIPEEMPAKDLAGKFEARWGSAADERAGAGVFTGKAGSFAWRLDGFRRSTGDVRIPGFAETDALLAHHNPADGPPAKDKLPNSAISSDGAGAGLTWFGQRAHVGVSFSGLGTLYGVPTGEEPPVKIDLRQRRADLHAEWQSDSGWLKAAKLQVGAGRYRHTEWEGLEVGTRFFNRAFEGRLELQHQPLAGLEGAIGLQTSRSDFSALGEEAFIPPSVTQQHAIFAYEEIPGNQLTWQFGARLDTQRIRPRDAALDSSEHTGASASVGFVWKLDEATRVAVSASHSERAPNAQELYADGPHAGTGVYEIGDDTLGIEQSRGFDISLRRRMGFVTGSATVFANDFSGFIFEKDTGTVDPVDGLPIYRFTQSRARFTGAELELIAHLHEGADHRADLRFSADHVRATDRSRNQPLPRIPPTRVGVGVDYHVAEWSFTADVRRSFAAEHLAPLETATAGHTLVSVAISRRLKLQTGTLDLFVRGANLTDETARVHASFLKDIAPLPGRDVTAGVRWEF